MALSDNLKNAGDEIERLNDLGTEFSAVYKDIGVALKGLANDSKDFGSGIGDAAKLSRDLSKSAQELAGFTKEDLKDRKKVIDFTKKADALQKNRAKLQSQIRTFQAQTVNATKAEQVILQRVNQNLQNSATYTQEIGEGFNDILDTSKNISKSNPFKGLGELVSEIPVLNKFFPEFEKASLSFRDNMAEGNGFLKSSVKAGGQLTGFFSKLTVGLIVGGLKDFDERSTSLARNLNVSRQQADQLVKSANSAARELKGVTGKEITDSQLSFANALGTTAKLSNESAANFAIIQKRLGLSVDEATEFTKLNEALGKNSKDQTEELIYQVQLSNAQTDSSIKYQDVLKDVANTNKAALLSLEGQNKSLGKAAFQAKLLGMSLNQLDGIAGGLLDFESSIAAEMEAELLTGKQLNLEKARQAALDGDLATLASEIAKEAGSLEEFQDMNRLQQEAIAKAVGMTREGLAASLVEQRALSKMSAKDTNELKEKTKLELKKIEALKAQGKLEEAEEARKKLIDKLGSDELVRQEETQNLQELQAKAAQSIVEAMDDLSPILKTVRNIFGKISEHTTAIKNVLLGILGITLITKFVRLLKVFKSLVKFGGKLKSFFGGGAKAVAKGGAEQVAKNSPAALAKVAPKVLPKVASKAGGGLAKIGAKFATKGAFKRIPILGSIMGVGFSIDRAIKGDYAGAAMELGSAGLGLLDLLAPGLGTGLSLAADAGIAARDLSMAGTMTPTAKLATGGIVTRPTTALIGEGGEPEAVVPLSKAQSMGFGGNSEVVTLLKELISAVKQGGDVYIDGAKAGRSLALATSKMG
tara:strand:- start:31 stop:2475 length:2445 start_codon:yes stop_codon:yes gene_type:complete